MTLIITLFAIGLVCLFAEVLVPGGILGAIGGLFMLVGCVVVWSDYGAAAGLTAIVAALLLAGATIYIELFVLPKTRFARGIFNNAAITGASQPPPASETDVVGRECVALTTLAPTGYVLLDGKRYEARSLDGYVEKDTRLLVTSLDTFTLQVTKK